MNNLTRAALLGAETKRQQRLLETAWGIIANVSGGNWGLQSPEWQGAAVEWREAYHKTLGDR